MKVLFDTNVLIDYLQGIKGAARELNQYDNPSISIITKMEILVGINQSNEEIIRDFLNNFNVISINEEIAEIAVILRKDYKIKLPNAIIWATAKYNNSLLITRNTKDFPVPATDIKVPCYI